jgi:hypothetical protein
VNTKEKIKARNSRYSHSPKGRFRSYKQNAERLNRSFLLSFDNFQKLLLTECTYCGKKPSMGIDRIDNAIGYELKNSISCCKMCNWFKNKFGAQEFVNHVFKIADNLRKVIV